MYMPPYMNPPTTYPQVIDKSLWNGEEQEQETGFRSQDPGLRVLDPDFWLLIPHTWLLDPALPLLLSEAVKKFRQREFGGPRDARGRAIRTTH
jgi:hypothetical protein